MNKQHTVAIDLDGVLSAFDQRVEQITNKKIRELSSSELWKAVARYDKEVEPFFEHMDKMPDADRLFYFIQNNFENFYILTATGHVPNNAGDQKRTWVAKNYGSDILVRTVRKSDYKAQYATPTTILIDDRSKSIDPWIAAGGIGVLHQNAVTTIAQLMKDYL